jgi:hypothetical protein
MSGRSIETCGVVQSASAIFATADRVASDLGDDLDS